VQWILKLTVIHNNNIIISEQFGFWSNLSTEKVAFDLIYEILEALTKKIYICGVYSSIWKRHLIVLIMAFY
jgi:hypothetical protein